MMRANKSPAGKAEDQSDSLLKAEPRFLLALLISPLLLLDYHKLAVRDPNFFAIYDKLFSIL